MRITEPSLTIAQLAFTRLWPACQQADVRLFVKYAPKPVQGTGSHYVVLLQASTGWQSDDYHTYVSHPRLLIHVYSDCSRDLEGNKVREDAEAKAQAIYEYLNPLLHMQTQATWPDIISCRRDSEPQFITIPDDADSVLLQARYEVSL